MNIPEEERARRAASRSALCELVADLQDTEAAVVDTAEKAAAEVIRQSYPVVAGCAIQSGHMKGRLTLEILFDLTRGAKAVEVKGTVQPSPISSPVRREVSGASE